LAEAPRNIHASRRVGQRGVMPGRATRLAMRAEHVVPACHANGQGVSVYVS